MELTYQQKYYKKNIDSVLAYKKDFYAKKNKSELINKFRNLKIVGKTKIQSNQIIKFAIKNNLIKITTCSEKDKNVYDAVEFVSKYEIKPESSVDCYIGSIGSSCSCVDLKYDECMDELRYGGKYELNMNIYFSCLSLK